MKIVCVSHYYTPHVGGLEIVAENQAVSLMLAGYEVTVLSCAGLKEKVQTEDVKGIKVYRLWALNTFDKRFSIPFPIVGIGFIMRSFNLIRKTDFVHVHDVFYMTSWVSLLFAFVFRKPLVLTQHVAMVPHTSGVVMLIQKVVYATFGKLLFNYAEKVVVYNPGVRDFLYSYGVSKNKVVLTHNGIETKLFSKTFGFDVDACRRGFGLPVNRKLVLFVGRLVPKKGYDILYKTSDPSFDLVYAGSGEVPPEWISNPNFYFLGSLTQKQLSDLYQAVDVFVFPAEGEMFTLVMQEAMASGLPIIATNEKGYSEYNINRELFILCERNVTDFKFHISRVLSSENLRQEMGNYSMSLSKTYFDWSTNFSNVLEIYKRIEKAKL